MQFLFHLDAQLLFLLQRLSCPLQTSLEAAPNAQKASLVTSLKGFEGFILVNVIISFVTCNVATSIVILTTTFRQEDGLVLVVTFCERCLQLGRRFTRQLVCVNGGCGIDGRRQLNHRHG